MSFQRPTYCRACGSALPPESEFCESCGSSVPRAPAQPTPQPRQSAYTYSSPAQDVVEQIRATSLPDPSIVPRVGRGLSIGWQILNEDIAGGMVVALLMFVGLIITEVLFIVGGFLILPAIVVGLMGWAEARRKGSAGTGGAFMKIGMTYFKDALLLGLVMFLFSLLWLAPLGLFYVSLIFGLGGPLGWGGPAATGISPSFPFTYGSFAWFVFAIVVAMLLSPVTTSLQGLGSWAIARGVPFRHALSWAWARIRRHFFRWWWAGFIVSLVSGMGSAACYVGGLVTIPWGAIALAEMAAYEGEEGE